MTHPTTVIKKSTGVMVRDAAKELDKTEAELFKLLRKHNYFNGKYPRLKHMHAGLFGIEQREFIFKHSGAKRSYHVATITPLGMASLNNIINNNSNVLTLNPTHHAVHPR